MKSVVVYASRFGNTKKIAEAIADGLSSKGPVQVISVDEAPRRLPAGTDLLVIGGPTEQHGMTEPVSQFFDRLASDALRGVTACTFDTRLRWPRWLSGSAAVEIAERLHRAGARVIASPKSFFIAGMAGTTGRDTTLLNSGEVERAEAWGATLTSVWTMTTTSLASTR